MSDRPPLGAAGPKVLGRPARKPRTIACDGFREVRCTHCNHLLCLASDASVVQLPCPKCDVLCILVVSGLTPRRNPV